MAEAGGQGASQAPASPEAYAPGGYAVRVMCDQGHPLRGLLVVWAARPPKGSAGGGSGGGDTPEAKIRAVADRHEPPPGRFAAAIVDEAGYLVPVFREANPWRDVFLDAKPHSFKLEPDQKHRFILLRHPSAALARGLADWLDGKQDQPFDFGPWGGVECFGGEGATPAKLVQERELTTTPPEGVKVAGQELFLVVPEADEPGDYWPKGHELYKKWTLYLDMPNAECGAVRREVGRLQQHLGALRFPIGIQERPYRAEPRKEKLPTGNLEIFEMRTAGALARFQEHAAAGRAFRVAASAVPHAHGRCVSSGGRFEPVASYREGEESWAYLLGDELGPAVEGAQQPATPQPGAILPEIQPADRLGRHAAGVVDRETGRLLRDWLGKGYRKPGKILLRVKGPPNGFVFLREEAAVQLEGWRQLGRIFGVSYDRCQYGLPSGHSYRDISGIARGVAGMLNNSIHKTGLAIDFALKSTRNDADYTRAADYWPVRIEQRFDEPKSDPAALAKRQLERAVAERKDLLAQREKDAAAVTASGGTIPQTSAPSAAAPATLEGARSASTLAKGSADTTRARAADALRRAGADAARKAKAVALLEETIRKDDVQRAALDAEIDLADREVKRIAQDEKKMKSSYRMRWCVYGHSTLDVFGRGRDEALKGLLGGIEVFGGTLEAHLASLFPAAVKAAGEAWCRDVALRSYLRPGDVARKLLSNPQGIVDAFFRCALRPFLFDPLEPDGGHSWEKALVPGASVQCPTYLKPLRPGERDVPCVADPGGAPAPLQPFAGNASSYVSLTGLGYLCDMFGIGTAGGKWKAAVETLAVSKGFAAVAKAIEAAANHAEAKEEDVVVVRGKSVVARLKPARLEVAFVTDWAGTLAELVVVPGGAKPKPSACFKAKGSQLVVRLPPPELAADGDRVVAVLKGKLSSRRFVVASVGKETGLDALLTAGALKGSELGAKLEAATKAFQERVNLLRNPPRDESVKDVKPGGKGKAKPPKPQDLAKRDRTLFEVTLQPLFEKGVVPSADRGNVILQPGDVVQVAAPGIPRTLEWWHFQSLVARGDPWAEQVKEIGFSEVILEGQEEPPERDGGDWDGRGIGYTDPELASTAGGIVAAAAPSNAWTPPPAGW